MHIPRLIGVSLAAILFLVIPIRSNAQVSVGISVQIGPPALPVYDQPICPGDGYIWTPGYWAYDNDDGYFWVPGTWVLAPVGLLWTPGYWAFVNEAYVWYPGYWGPEVGFYGGINYGYGYVGTGYEGGYWNSGAFYYNRSVNHVEHVTNVYNKTVINNVTVNNISYNGGPGGTEARPSPKEQAAMRAQHTPPTAEQTQHERTASTNRQQWASVNQGKPPVAATAKPAEFSGKGVISAKAAAPYHPAPNPGASRPGSQAEKSNRPMNSPAETNPRYNGNQPPAQPEERARNPRPQDEQQQQKLQQQQQKQEQEQQKMQQKQQQEEEKRQQNQRMEQERQQQERQQQQRQEQRPPQYNAPEKRTPEPQERNQQQARPEPNRQEQPPRERPKQQEEPHP